MGTCTDRAEIYYIRQVSQADTFREEAIVLDKVLEAFEILKKRRLFRGNQGHSCNLNRTQVRARDAFRIMVTIKETRFQITKQQRKQKTGQRADRFTQLLSYQRTFRQTRLRKLWTVLKRQTAQN
jgi:hypothetical protein